jgi:hypothetical protein
MTHKKLLFILLISAGLFQSSFTYIHPLKATSTRITYLPEKKELQVSISVFRDDFQKSLNTELNSRFDLIHYYNSKDATDAVYTFFNKFISISINDKVLSLKYDEVLNDEDKNSFVYTTILKNYTFKGKQKIDITNKMLLNYFPNQANVVVINIPDKLKKVIQFDKNLTSETVIF